MASVLASRSAAKGRRLNIGSTNASDAYTVRSMAPSDVVGDDGGEWQIGSPQHGDGHAQA